MADKIELHCWLLGSDPDHISVVQIEKTQTIASLRNSIKAVKTQALRGHDAHTLALWKFSMVKEEVNTRLEDINLDSLSDQHKLWVMDPISKVFPAPPEDGCVYLVVVQPKIKISSSSSIKSQPADASFPSGESKRGGSPSAGQDKTKKRRMDVISMLPSDAALKSLYMKLQEINPDPNWYSDPQNIDLFPFPFVYSRLPVDRFDLTAPPESSFAYMGRKSFSEVWSMVNALKSKVWHTRLYIAGTMGYGKSHLLAVLVGLLSRSGKRTIYLPDCRELLVNDMRYMQSALLCAFADPSSSDERNKIRALQSLDDVNYFCGEHAPVYFIIDQMNALDCEGDNMNTADNQRKAAAQGYLGRLTAGHYQITSRPANHRTAMHMIKDQTGDIKLALMGGMSEDEMEQWWIHHQGKVPIFEDGDKAKVEDLTGRIPLLLRPLLDFAEKPFHDIEQKFWMHRDLAAVGVNVTLFADDIKQNEPAIYEEWYLSTLVGCLTASRVLDFGSRWFDYRYFYPDKPRRGSCVCGLAREAAAIVIRRGSPGLLCDDRWLMSLRTFKDNPYVIRFLVEQACLSAISGTGFHHDGGINWDSLPATIIEDDLIQAIPSVDCEIFFVPENPFCKDIDALYLKVDVEKETALVVPIQITVAKTHKDSEAAFYSQWYNWQERFRGYELKTTFVWVVENTQSWAVMEEEFRTTRHQSRLIFPEHEQIIMTVTDISRTVGLYLRELRTR